ncbi:hypothetical protein HPB47_005647 [Ixodes persulcatus]|uniref:Uncharacterized protein n=1 Tax=Ixodes persulcatus TaxID=34615 RepID=A0AC60PCD3_IXOPE|nr:hypothetical protein HPB47_005647 [Ixodes persulcatus]
MAGTPCLIFLQDGDKGNPDSTASRAQEWLHAILPERTSRHTKSWCALLKKKLTADLDEDVGAHDHDDDAEPRLPHGGPVGPPTELARTHSTGCPRPLHENIREPRRRGALAVASRDDDAGVVLPASRCRRTSRRRHAATAWLALDARPTDSALAAETAPKFLPSPPTTPPAAALALSASR